MSMICNFRRISSQIMERIKRNPSLIEALLSLDYEIEEIALGDGVKIPVPVSMKAYLEKAPPANRKTMINMLKRNAGVFRKMLDDKKKAKLILGDIDPDDGMDIDKAWHGIHFLLTGETWGGKLPLSNTIMGGKEIGKDLGYGPAKYLTPKEVAEVASALLDVDADEIRSRFDLAEMNRKEIYAVTSEEDDEYIMEYFTKLVDFYKIAAEKGDCMIIFIS